jgi:polyphenol oxidase
MIWHNFENEYNGTVIKAFTSTKSELPLYVQRAFNEKEDPGLKATLWQNIYLTLASQLLINPGQLVFAKQTHSANIKIVDGKYEGVPFADTDGLITNLKGICLCIQTADCTPVLLFDPIHKVVAAIHAGWRGTSQNITGNAVSLMKEHFDSDPTQIIAYIGPCISQDIYEVGNDVYEAFNVLGLASEKVFKEGKSPGKYYCNLNSANSELLLRHGVLDNNIKTDNHCTYQQKELYYSARRDGGKTGRIITGIMIN